jgi:hypothetical protein
MWTLIRRAIVPLVVLLSAVASVIYGARYHRQPVAEEREIEISLADPMPFPPAGPDDGASPFGDPGGFGPPPGMGGFFAAPTKIIEKVLVTKEEAEPTLIREVTFGGVVLMASGELMRTYTGQPPSMCPT